MGNYSSIQKKIYSYKDVQQLIKRNGIHQDRSSGEYLLINTLPIEKQNCLIKNTCPGNHEERIINELLTQNRDCIVCIYGEHSCDVSIHRKYEQLSKIGFNNVYMYIGGLFEWLCLQDIYSDSYFETAGKHNEILDYSPGEKRRNQVAGFIPNSKSLLRQMIGL